jgi:hypothetical protein
MSWLNAAAYELLEKTIGKHLDLTREHQGENR